MICSTEYDDPTMNDPADLARAAPAEFRQALVTWLAERGEEVRPPYADHGTTAELLAHQHKVQALLFDEGFMRCGWPVAVGGLGGSPLLRAVLGEELTWRGLVHSAAFSMTEVLGPAVVQFAPDLAGAVMPGLLRGDELWCQGFSEPEAGSDLGSLRTKAVEDGETWVITGQKLWTSWAHHAARCIVLARTEEGVSGSKGVSAFFVDMDSAGVSTRPLRTMADVDEFCETFFDEVRVSSDRLLGIRGAGWAVAQHILSCERGPIFWQRGAWLLHYLGEAARLAPVVDDNRRGSWVRRTPTSSPSEPALATPNSGLPPGSSSVPRRRSTRFSSPRRIRQCSMHRGRCCRVLSSSTTQRLPTGSARNGVTRAPPRSTGARQRSSATSWDGVSSDCPEVRDADGCRGTRDVRGDGRPPSRRTG